MKLNTLERINLMGILPTETNYVTYKIVNDLKGNLSFSEDELKEYEMKFENDMVFFNPAKSKDKEIEIGEKATDIIIEALNKLDKENKINNNNISLYEKFVINK